MRYTRNVYLEIRSPLNMSFTTLPFSSNPLPGLDHSNGVETKRDVMYGYNDKLVQINLREFCIAKFKTNQAPSMWGLDEFDEDRTDVTLQYYGRYITILSISVSAYLYTAPGKYLKNLNLALIPASTHEELFFGRWGSHLLIKISIKCSSAIIVMLSIPVRWWFEVK